MTRSGTPVEKLIAGLRLVAPYEEDQVRLHRIGQPP